MITTIRAMLQGRIMELMLSGLDLKDCMLTIYNEYSYTMEAIADAITDLAAPWWKEQASNAESGIIESYQLLCFDFDGSLALEISHESLDFLFDAYNTWHKRNGRNKAKLLKINKDKVLDVILDDYEEVHAT